MTKDVRVYLAHILESIDKIERFTADGRDRYLRDPMVHDAVIRNLEIIGEAAKRVDDAYRAAHPGVPWRALAGLRDVLSSTSTRVSTSRACGPSWSATCRRSDSASDRCFQAWTRWSASWRATRFDQRTSTMMNRAGSESGRGSRGFGGAVARLFWHGPMRDNPLLCKACFGSLSRHPGGAELEISVVFA